MGTSLGVMCLFFQCRFSFLDVPSPVRMEQPEVVWSCLHCNSAMLARAYVHNCMFQENQGLGFEEGTT